MVSLLEGFAVNWEIFEVQIALGFSGFVLE